MTKNLTAGKPAKLIFFFTIPLLIGNVFQQLYNMADTLIVGRTISVNALAAVGCSSSIMFFIIGFAQGTTSGFAIITAQRFGAGDMRGVRKSIAASAMLSALTAVVLTAASVPLARPILQMLNTPAEIIDDAHSYLSVIFIGTGASILFNLLSNIIRALGDSRTPLLFLVVACVINIALDFLFIKTFHMGTAGAAWATLVAQIASGLCCLVYMLKKLPVTRLKKEDWVGAMRDFLPHIKVGFPMGFQSSIISIGQIALQGALNSLGATSVAAYTAAQKIDTIATMPMMSFGITMATYTAQNYGAEKISRIRKGVRQCLIMSVSFSFMVALVNILLGGFFVEFFVGAGQEQVVELARIYLITNGVPYFMLAILFIIRYTLQGLGKSFVPTFAGIMELGMRVFTAIILAKYWHFTGACLSNPLAWVGACIPLCISYLLTMKKLETEHDPGRGPDDTQHVSGEGAAAQQRA